MGLTAQTSNILPYSNPYSLWENFGSLFLQMINLCFRFFGVSAFSLRLLPAISGVLAIPAVYLFSRQITNKRVATIAAILLAISHTHIHFSRIVSVGYIHSTWLAPLELYLLLSGLEKKSSWRTALAGVLLAVHFSVYLTSQIITALILVFMVICIIFLRKSFMQVLRQAGAFWGGFFLMILPELYYITQNPNQFFDRLNQDGLMTNGWLAQTVASTGQSTIEILANRVIHAFLSLIYYPAVDFYGSSVPMLTLIGAVLFLIGLGIALIRARTYGYLLLNGYFWAATLAVGIFAVPPSADSYRMLIALPPAIIMAALALDEIVSLFGISWERSRRSYVFIASIVLIGLFGYNFWAYYVDFVGQCRYGGGIVGRFASYVGDFVSDQVNPNDTVYLLSDDIYFHGSHASTDFLSNSRPIINYSDPISTLQVYSGDVIIANPDRFSELEDWSHTIPGSELIHIYDCRSLILLAYQVP